MAFPLKSGADLYNQQLIRAAIWNHGADPSETVTGLMYFNTSNSNVGKKLRVHNGSGWKTLAFEEDLDVANNAEFKALEDKVKLLAGEVDTDSIISNMKEVSNFLAGFAEDANLMSVLDGKLDKSGGTISGAGTIDIRRSEGPYSSIIKFSNKSSVLGYIGFNSEKSFSVWSDLDSSPYTLLHSGNVKSVNGIFVSRGTLTSNNDLNTLLDVGAYSTQSSINQPTDFAGWYGDLINYRFPDSTNWQLFATNTLNTSLFFRKQTGDAWSDWKTIAFTDSNVASATKLETPRTIWGRPFDGTGDVDGMITVSGFGALHRDDTALWVNYEGGDAEKNLCLCGNRIAFYSGKASNFNAVLLINQQGNVLIGTKEDKGQKLQVDGDVAMGNGVSSSLSMKRGYYNRFTATEVGGMFAWNVNGANTDVMVLTTTGRLGVGVTAPLAMLHVNEDIVANGTIACKGVAAEGSEVGMGTVDKKVLSIPSSTTQQTFSLTHGLNTREITVCIYEVTSTGTNMILTDVEITGDNTISVSFGNPPSENHMVVVMG